MSVSRFLLFEPLSSVHKDIFVQWNQGVLLYIDLSGIINCNTFSVVPSVINENATNELLYWNNITKCNEITSQNLRWKFWITQLKSLWNTVATKPELGARLGAYHIRKYLEWLQSNIILELI
jgi:hypothetical protein